MNEPSYKLLREWDVNLAKYVYVLYSVTKASPMTSGYAVRDGFVYEELASGDIDWAKRTADHFNIKVEQEDL